MSTRILLVEDMREIRKLLETGLLVAGFDVDTASDGQVALRKLHQNQYDFLITDVIMPRMTGFELVAQILRGDVPRLPFIIMGAGGDHFKWAVARFGEAKVMSKPLDISELAARVRRILEEERQNDN